MNRLKQLMEELGSLNKQRRSKVKELEELAAKEDFTDEDQTRYDNLKDEIATIDAKRERKETAIETVKKQEEIENNGDSFDAFFPGGSNGIDGEEKELSNFRIVKAFREAADPNSGLTGLERDVNQQAVNDARDSDKNLEGNLHIPQQVLFAQSRFNQPMNSRQMTKIYNDLTVDGGTGGDQGGLTVDTDLRSLIDILTSKLVFTGENGLGATFFTDLNGDIEFPRAEEDTTDPATKTETGAADEQSPTFGSLAMSPTRLPTFTEVTRKLLLQSSISVEMWLRNYLMYKLKKKMEKDIINHILSHADVNAVVMGDPDGGAPTWEKVVEFETRVSNADADEPQMGFLSNPSVRGELKTTEKVSGTAEFLWDSDNEVNNYPAMISTLVPGNLTKGAGTNLSAAIFANWASLYIAQWGGFDFLVNPYSRDSEGIIKINAWTFFDQGLRHPEAFAASSDITTSVTG